MEEDFSQPGVEFELEYDEVVGGYKIVSSKLDTGSQTFFDELPKESEEGTDQVIDKENEDREIEGNTVTKEPVRETKDEDQEKGGNKITEEPVNETEEIPVKENEKTTENDAGDMEKQPQREEFEFPVLTRVEPGKVGDVVEVELEDGVTYKRITKATEPPVFGKKVKLNHILKSDNLCTGEATTKPCNQSYIACCYRSVHVSVSRNIVVILLQGLPFVEISFNTYIYNYKEELFLVLRLFK